MNIKLIARYIGIALLFNALFMFISLGVSALNGFDSSFSPLLLSALITAMVGCFPLIFVRGQDDVNLREGFAITIFSWILSCIFGMLPYVMWGGEFTLPNAGMSPCRAIPPPEELSLETSRPCPRACSSGAPPLISSAVWE